MVFVHLGTEIVMTTLSSCLAADLLLLPAPHVEAGHPDSDGLNATPAAMLNRASRSPVAVVINLPYANSRNPLVSERVSEQQLKSLMTKTRTA